MSRAARQTTPMTVAFSMLALPALLALSALLALAATAARAEPADSAVAGGEVATGVLDGDLYTNAALFLAFSAGDLRVGLHAPLRVRVFDRGAPADGDTPGIRSRDWDEPSDWTRILRFASWGDPDDPVELRLGELTGASLGHGTIVDRFYNTLDLDHYRSGLRVQVDTGAIVVQALVDDVLKADLSALRVAGRPWRAPTGWRSLEVGATVAVDRNAPWIDAGTPATGLNSVGRIQSADSVAVVSGLDAALTLWRKRDRTLAAYTDVVALRTDSPQDGTTWAPGVHLGLGLELPDLAGNVALGSRIELRAWDQGYLPTWVDAFYEVQRYDYRPAAEVGGTSKTAWARRASERSMGALVSADALFAQIVQVSATFEWSADAGNGLQLWVVVPERSGLELRAAYGVRGVLDAEDLGDLDRANALLSARYRLGGPAYAAAVVGQRWQAVDGASPHYQAVLEATVGAGIETRF